VTDHYTPELTSPVVSLFLRKNLEVGISEVRAFVPNYCLLDLMPVMDAQVYFSIVKANYNWILFTDCYM